MGQLVRSIATVHAPFIVGRPDVAPSDKREKVDLGFAELRAIVEAAQPDVIVCVASEHITNILSTNAPPFLVGTADSNRTQPEFGLPDVRVPGDPEFATGFVRYAFDRGLDLAHSSRLALDHGTSLPLHYLTPDYDIPVVPIIANTVWSPMAPASRSALLGDLLADYIKHEAGDKRVLVLGTGGISHWVGNERHGDMNEEFDRWFLSEMKSGDYSAMRELSQQTIDEGGDGANEIRNWISAATAASRAGLKPRVVLDETFVPGWNVSVYQMVWE